MIKLFGQSRSRAGRSLWMLEEIGIPFEHVPIRAYTESRTPDYLRINPNGHIPSLDDDGFILWESLAINLYLAEAYAQAPLWPADARGRGLAYQWSFWAANEIEPRIVSIAKGLSKTPPDEAAVASEMPKLADALHILDRKLGNVTHLLGDAFTIADLNLASTLREPSEQGIASISAIELAPFQNVVRWLDCCSERPANRRVVELA
jgi:glutathione S-transferase